MKTRISIIAFTLLAFISANAQDMLILKSGEDINSKIVEVNNQEIKYKKFENIDGPTYTILKADVFMIKYQNGTKETFDNNAASPKPNIKSPVNQPAKTNSYSDHSYKLKKGKLLTGLGTSFTTVGTALLVSGGVVFANSYDYYTGFYDIIAEENGIIMMSVGSAVFVAGLPMMITGLVKMGSAKKGIRLSQNGQSYLHISPTLLPNYSKQGNVPGMNFTFKF